MKIYFNSIGIITNVSNIGDSLRQGSVGNVLEAHFEGVDNAYYSAKFNFTRSDGSKVNNVVMEWDNNNAEVFRFVFNDSWFFALAGTTTLTIYLYDTNGNVTTQGQHQFSIESTDYDEEPTITINQYNEIMTAVAGKVATGNIIDNLESDASDKPLSARMGKALKQDVDAVAEELSDKIVKKHTYEGEITFDESLNNLGFNSFEEIRNTDIIIWENPNLIDVGDGFTIYKGTYIFRKQSETSNDNLFVFSCLLTGFYTFSPIVGDKTVISLTLGTTISKALEAVATVSRNNATTIKYSNKDSGLKASRVQNAIDELADKTVKNTENVSNLNKETDSINGKITDLKNALYGSILDVQPQTYENVGTAVIDRANGYPIVDNQKAQVMSIKGKTEVINGEIVNTNITKIVVGGFNKFDEEWEVGGINAQGIANSNVYNARSKNYISVVGGQNYTISNGNYIRSGTTETYVIEYNENYTTLRRTPVGNFPNVNTSRSIQLLNETKYIKFFIFINDYNFTNNFPEKGNWCFHLTGDGSFNGTYKPYKEPTEVEIEPVELNGIGSAQDERTETQYKKVIGSVDLGTFDWNYNNESGHERFSVNISSIAKLPLSNGDEANILCVKYKTTNASALYNEGSSVKQMALYTNGSITISDSDYTNATTFKQSLQGVILYYELATPTVEENGLGEVLVQVERGGTISTASNADMTLAHVVYKPMEE